MPLSSIAQIFIRLYSIKILVGSFAVLGAALSTVDGGSFVLVNLLINLLPNILMITAGVVLWKIAPRLSKVLVRGGDGDLTLAGVTREDLFAAVLLGLGVYFIMGSFSNVLGWVHYFSVNRMAGGFHMDKGISYYDLTEELLTLVAGMALTAKCRKWARRFANEPETGQGRMGSGL